MTMICMPYAKRINMNIFHTMKCSVFTWSRSKDYLKQIFSTWIINQCSVYCVLCWRCSHSSFSIMQTTEVNEWIHFTGNDSEIRILKNCRLLRIGWFGHSHGENPMWMHSISKKINIFLFFPLSRADHNFHEYFKAVISSSMRYVGTQIWRYV